VTASFLSSGKGTLTLAELRIESYELCVREGERLPEPSRDIKCVLVDLNPLLAVRQIDGDHVEPAGLLGEAMPGQVVHGYIGHTPSLEPGDRVGSPAKLTTIARFHFDEHHRLPVAGDDVQFSTAAAVPARKNCITTPFELPNREIFSGFAEGLPSARHRAIIQQALRHLQPSGFRQRVVENSDRFVGLVAREDERG
jgi:hypothetical protein